MEKALGENERLLHPGEDEGEARGLPRPRRGALRRQQRPGHRHRPGIGQRRLRRFQEKVRRPLDAEQRTEQRQLDFVDGEVVFG